MGTSMPETGSTNTPLASAWEADGCPLGAGPRERAVRDCIETLHAILKQVREDGHGSAYDKAAEVTLIRSIKALGGEA